MNGKLIQATVLADDSSLTDKNTFSILEFESAWGRNNAHAR